MFVLTQKIVQVSLVLTHWSQLVVYLDADGGTTPTKLHLSVRFLTVADYLAYLVVWIAYDFQFWF